MASARIEDLRSRYGSLPLEGLAWRFAMDEIQSTSRQVQYVIRYRSTGSSIPDHLATCCSKQEVEAYCKSPDAHSVEIIHRTAAGKAADQPQVTYRKRPRARSDKKEAEAWLEYFEADVPSGDGLCSDNDCPCPNVVIPRGEGYLYISQEIVNFRRIYRREEDAERAMRKSLEQKYSRDPVLSDLHRYGATLNYFFRTGPILVCELGARRRNLNLEVAAADAKRWWKTGQVPLRATPLANIREGTRDHQQEKVVKRSVEIVDHLQEAATATKPRAESDSIPSDLDIAMCQIMRLERRREALKKDTGHTSKEQIAEIEQELTGLQAKTDALKKQGQAETQALRQVYSIQEQIKETTRQLRELEEAECQCDFSLAAELRYRWRELERRLQAEEDYIVKSGNSLSPEQKRNAENETNRGNPEAEKIRETEKQELKLLEGRVMSDVNTIIDTASKLPEIPDAEIQQHFNRVHELWGAKDILIMSETDLYAAIAAILAGDTREGFKLVTPGLNGPLLQFNTISEAYFRGHRIAKKQNGEYALFGHNSTYRHVSRVWPTIIVLAHLARRQEWNIFASLTIRCSSCGATYELTPDYSTRGALMLVQQGKQAHSPDQAFRCQSCQSESFTIENTRRSIKAWLRGLCESLGASDDDPRTGFEDVERGGVVQDHPFHMAGDFDHLWATVGDRFDPNGWLNAKHSFNIVWSRRLSEYRKVRLTPSIIHHNENTDKVIEIIRDRNGYLWFYIS